MRRLKRCISVHSSNGWLMMSIGLVRSWAAVMLAKARLGPRLPGRRVAALIGCQ